jgi:hypothetical protein
MIRGFLLPSRLHTLAARLVTGFGQPAIVIDVAILVTEVHIAVPAISTLHIFRAGADIHEDALPDIVAFEGVDVGAVQIDKAILRANTYSRSVLPGAVMVGGTMYIGRTGLLVLVKVATEGDQRAFIVQAP